MDLTKFEIKKINFKQYLVQIPINMFMFGKDIKIIILPIYKANSNNYDKIFSKIPYHSQR